MYSSPETNVWVHVFGRGFLETPIGEWGSGTRRQKGLIKSALWSNLWCGLKQHRTYTSELSRSKEKWVEVFIYQSLVEGWSWGHSYSPILCVFCVEAEQALVARKSHQARNEGTLVGSQAGMHRWSGLRRYGVCYSPLLAPLSYTHGPWWVCSVLTLILQICGWSLCQKQKHKKQ